MVFEGKAQEAPPSLEDETRPPLTPEDLLVRNLALMKTGARVVLLIHGVDGFVCQEQQWREFGSRWEDLDIRIEINAPNNPTILQNWVVLPYKQYHARNGINSSSKSL